MSDTLSFKETGEVPSKWRTRIAGAIAIWAILVATAIAALTAYSMTPGESDVPPRAQSIGIPVGAADFTLVMSIHPHCKCTHASLENLKRLLLESEKQVQTRILLFYPGDESLAWAQTDVWDSALNLPNAVVQEDPDGHLSAQLGCQTSGAAVLYDRHGRPLFWGGITPGRGHSGDNPGSDMIRSILEGRIPAPCTAPVFGCSLKTPTVSALVTAPSERVRQ